MSDASEGGEEWPEPEPNPHLRPLKTTANAANEVLLFTPLGVLAAGSVIAAVEAYRIWTGEPAALAILNGSLVFVLILVVGAIAGRIEEGKL